jgi:hypothetical protein
MPEHERRRQKKQEEIDQKHRIKRKESKSLADQLHTFKDDTTPVTETPFKPSVDEHTALLAQARSNEERANQVFHLQRTYGNRYVRRLLNSSAIQSKLEVNPPNDVYEPKTDYLSQTATEEQEEQEMVVEDRSTATEPVEEEEEMVGEDVVAETEPGEEEEEMIGDRGSIVNYSGIIGAKQKLSPVLVPVDPSKAGACVIVKDKKFDAWYNPSEPKCVLGGMKIHEEKHIADFQADPNYKDIPTKGLTWNGPVKGPVPDGETFYYRNSEDAKKFEHAAIDLEIAWLNEQLKTNLSETDKNIITKRATKILPAYRKSFG